jgi:hypothetical protein
MKLKVICVAYERPVQLLGLICSFVAQTNPNWELYIIYDGEVPEDVNRAKSFVQDERVFFSNTPTRNGLWGHPNRKIALESIPGEPGDYVLITNDDNYYVTSFVDQMLTAASVEDTGMVACYTVHSYNLHAVHKSEVRENGIDMGAFIVRLDIARWVGFNHTHMSADGAYAEECGNHCSNEGLRIMMIPRPLFIHN